MEWKEIFNYGVPTAVLLIILFALWRIILWAKKVVVEPIVDAHLKTIQAFATELPHQTAVLKSIKDSVSELNGQKQILTDLSATASRIEKRAEENVREIRNACRIDHEHR